MAKRIKSGLKRLRQSAVRSERNQAVKSRAKTLVKRSAEGTAESVAQAIKAIDKAAAKGIIHKNAAARRKSRLVRRARAARAET